MGSDGNCGVPHAVHLFPTNPRIILRLRHRAVSDVFGFASPLIPRSAVIRSLNLVYF